MSLRHVKLSICAFVVMALALPTGAAIKNVAETGPSSAQAEMKEWTLLMYWDADNNLEFCTDFALETWENALTSNENVNIVAYVDILSKNGTWIYEVKDGVADIVCEWDEKNSSSPDTLKEFLLHGLRNYPANKTMLVVQDHGYSWRGVCSDDTDGNDSLMLVDGMAAAIRDARAENGGKGVDLLALDACSVATVEIAYELRETVPWFVASQLVVPYDGLPYDMIVRALVGRPTMTAGELAYAMVDMNAEYYSSKQLYDHIYPYDQDFVALSAFDMSLVDELGTEFMEMTEVLRPLVAENAATIQAAWDYALDAKWANCGGWEYLPDACTLFEGLLGIYPALDAAIGEFLSAFDAALVNEESSPRFGEVPRGLNINFPPSLATYNSESWKWAQQFVYHDIGLDLVDESDWAQCLMEYYFSDPGLQNRENVVTA